MGVRWNTYGIHLSCFAMLILVLGIQGCWSLNAEGLALLELRARVDYDPYGAFANWNPHDNDPCMWPGVYCVSGNVQMLDLNGLYLEGELAPDLGKLTYVRAILLYNNHFSGAIPKEFGGLTMLEVLDLKNNNLSGTIPAELGRLKSLKLLLLCNNNFQGEIPLGLRKLNSLSELQFDKNLASTVDTGIGSVHRKFGQRHLVNIVRRRLLQQSSNLAAAPANGGSPPEQIIARPTSRSSGSFPAVPNGKKMQPHQPVPSPADPLPPPHNPNSSIDQKQSSGGTSGNTWKYIVVISSVSLLIIVAVAMFFVCRNRAGSTIGPWKTGLSGQLQKAFVTGVPKLNRPDVQTACEDFSNIINGTIDGCKVYKGTLSSGVEIAVVSSAISSAKDWTQRSELTYRKKIDILSRVNHKNFVNVLGYCEEDEPFTRMMVFEYVPNGSLFEHLHVKEFEHLDWNTRMRIVMGTAYCLQHMHGLNPPVAHSNLSSATIFLTDDYAAKIVEIDFWAEISSKSKNKSENESEHSERPLFSDPETNVYSFGALLLEIISGKLPYSEEKGPLVSWAAEYLNDKESISHLIDPTLKSFKNNELDIICEVIRDCIQQDARRRPTMKEVISRLREVIAILPDAATPSQSPLWWAELEILTAEAA